ncbi:MAG: thioredoxin domain-containing protein [Sulfuriflexus sp.]|nr:thioredoxin domain-containing protein [Sulfuriflexus sp.]
MLRIIFLLTLLLPALSQAESVNVLKNNPSPYLAMHGNDPVNWQEWNSDVVARAKAEKKLLFVSIGYFACHWCHVMQKESYQAEDVAKILNDKFISVKVDRELNPALDARMIEFVNRTRGYSGWPLNVFITPEGYPLFGMVYLPHDDFKALIGKLSSYWDEDSAGLLADAKQAASELAPELIDLERVGLTAASEKAGDVLIDHAMQRADQFMGGFGEQSKFPVVPRVAALLEQYANSHDEKLGKFLKRTLDSMQKYGLNDSLGGGFFRYTVDPQWRVPHFEKMLYDNALLASLYFRAAEVFENDKYQATAVATTAFMRDTLGTKSGGLVASLSAVDDKNVEGGYYLWSRNEVKGLLNKQEWAVAEPAWSIFGTPTLEGLFLPVAEADLDELAEEKTIQEANIKKKDILKLLSFARSKLLTAREKRGLPVDTKKLAGWNGLALSAFVKAATVTKNEKDIQAAKKLRDFLVNELWDGTAILRARDVEGKVIGRATIEDYAFVAAGLLDWANYKGKQDDYQLAIEITRQAWQRFFDAQGWKLSEENLLAYGISEHVISDGPMPSPAAVILKVTQELLKRNKNNNKLPLKKFNAALAASEQQVLDDPFWFSSYIAAFELSRD